MIIQYYNCDFEQYNLKLKHSEIVREEIKEYVFADKEKAFQFASLYGYEVLIDNDRKQWVVYSKIPKDNWKCGLITEAK